MMSLESSKSYYFNKMLEGFFELKKNNGFTFSSKTKELTEKTRIENNSVLSFLSENPITEPVNAKSYYVLYQQWANEQNLAKPYSKPTFKKLLEQHEGIEHVKSKRIGDKISPAFINTKYLNDDKVIENLQEEYKAIVKKLKKLGGTIPEIV